MKHVMLIPASDIEPALHAVALKVAGQYGHVLFHLVPEAPLAAGRLRDIDAFFHHELPAMRRRLQEHLAHAHALHAIIGNDIGTLYATYYALLERRVPVHVSWYCSQFGGDSRFSTRYRAVLDRIGAMIMEHAVITKCNERNSVSPEDFYPRLHHPIPLIDASLFQGALLRDT